MDERPDPSGVGLHFPLVESDGLGFSLPMKGSLMDKRPDLSDEGLHFPLDESDLLRFSVPKDNGVAVVSDRLGINYFLMNYDGGRHQNWMGSAWKEFCVERSINLRPKGIAQGICSRRVEDDVFSRDGILEKVINNGKPHMCMQDAMLQDVALCWLCDHSIQDARMVLRTCLHGLDTVETNLF